MMRRCSYSYLWFCSSDGLSWWLNNLYWVHLEFCLFLYLLSACSSGRSSVSILVYSLVPDVVVVCTYWGGRPIC